MSVIDYCFIRDSPQVFRLKTLIRAEVARINTQWPQSSLERNSQGHHAEETRPEYAWKTPLKRKLPYGNYFSGFWMTSLDGRSQDGLSAISFLYCRQKLGLEWQLSQMSKSSIHWVEFSWETKVRKEKKTIRDVVCMVPRFSFSRNKQTLYVMATVLFLTCQEND